MRLFIDSWFMLIIGLIGPVWLLTSMFAFGAQRQGLRLRKETGGATMGRQFSGACLSQSSSMGGCIDVFNMMCLDAFGLEQQQLTEATNSRKYARQMMLPMPECPKTSIGTFISTENGREVPMGTSFGHQQRTNQLGFLTRIYSHSDTCLMHSLRTTLKLLMRVDPRLLSTNPLA